MLPNRSTPKNMKKFPLGINANKHVLSPADISLAYISNGSTLV